MLLTEKHSDAKLNAYCPAGGTQVTRAYIKESTYSWNIEKISICLNRDREELVGNDDVSIFYCLRPQVRNG